MPNRKVAIEPSLIEEISAYIERNLSEDHSEESDVPRLSRDLDNSKVKIDLDKLVRELEQNYPNGILAEVSRTVEEGSEEPTFTSQLLHYMNLRNYTAVECYKKAHIDRKLFSQIQKDPNYKPKKATAVAFALALQLNQDECQDFLETAGFALSKHDTFDLIIRFCVERKIYDIDVVNAILYQFDQPVLGSR